MGLILLTPPDGSQTNLVRSYGEDWYFVTDPREMNAQGEPRTGYLPRISRVLADVKAGYQMDEWKAEQNANLGVEGARFDMIVRMEIGTNVHRLAQNYLKGVPCGLYRDRNGEKQNRRQWTEREWLLFVKWTDWFLSAKTEVLAVEQTVWDWNLGVAGTLDAILKREETETLEVEDGVFKTGKNAGAPKFRKEEITVTRTRCWDWKTSKAVMRTHKIQAATYARCAASMFGITIDGAAVLALGTPPTRSPQESLIDSDLCGMFVQVFKNRKAVFDDEHPDYSPEIKELPIEFLPVHHVPEIVIEEIEPSPFELS